MDLIDEMIEKSWYKFNPVLTAACLRLLELMKKDPPKDRSCWRFMHMLFLANKCMPMNLPYYWYKEGIVVDPEMLMIVTRGIIRFRWDDECVGCQIETSCICSGNPNNDAYATVEARLKQLL